MLPAVALIFLPACVPQWMTRSDTEPAVTDGGGDSGPLIKPRRISQAEPSDGSPARDAGGISEFDDPARPSPSAPEAVNASEVSARAAEPPSIHDSDRQRNELQEQLLKPVLDEPGPSQPSRKPERSTVTEGPSPGPESLPSRSASSRDPGSNSGPTVGEEDSPKNNESPAGDKDQSSSGGLAGLFGFGTNKENGNAAKPGEDNRFIRHDPSAYRETVEKSARETVERSPKASLARLCREDITGEWILNLYEVRGARYSFSSYVWDAVDEQWERAFSVKPRSKPSLKDHLRFNAAGKDCRILKDLRR